MVKRLTKIVTWNPNIFVFISGVLASTATNLLTSLITSESSNLNRPQVVVATGLFLASAVSLMVVAWQLEEPHGKWFHWKRQQWSSEIDLTDEEIEQSAIGKKLHKLWLWMTAWMTFFLGGLVLVLV